MAAWVAPAAQIAAVVMQDPAAALSAARTGMSVAGNLAGLSDGDMAAIRGGAVPAAAWAVAAFGLGAVLAVRYAPDPWLKKVRGFGR